MLVFAFAQAALEDSEYAANQTILCSKLVYATRRQDGNNATTTDTFQLFRVECLPAAAIAVAGRVHVLELMETHPEGISFVERMDDMAQCVLTSLTALAIGEAVVASDNKHSKRQGRPPLLLIPLYATRLDLTNHNQNDLSVLIVQTADGREPSTRCELFSKLAVRMIQQVRSTLLSVDSIQRNNDVRMGEILKHGDNHYLNLFQKSNQFGPTSAVIIGDQKGVRPRHPPPPMLPRTRARCASWSFLGSAFAHSIHSTWMTQAGTMMGTTTTIISKSHRFISLVSLLASDLPSGSTTLKAGTKVFCKVFFARFGGTTILEVIEA